MTGTSPIPEFKPLIFELDGPDSTRDLGRAIGELARGGEVLALVGDLGAGKTTLTQGLALGVGLETEREITSPTFVLLIHHTGGRLELFHADLYRLDAEEAYEIGLEDHLGHPESITVVEWAERAEELLPSDLLLINLTWTGPDSRRAEISARGPVSRRLMEGLKTRQVF